jgi:hypothetical protein
MEARDAFIIWAARGFNLSGIRLAYKAGYDRSTTICE